VLAALRIGLLEQAESLIAAFRFDASASGEAVAALVARRRRSARSRRGMRPACVMLRHAQSAASQCGLEIPQPAVCGLQHQVPASVDKHVGP
jgi:hypothetical protein